MRHFIIIMLFVAAGSLYAEEQQEEQNGLFALSTDLLTYRVTMNPDDDKPAYDMIQFGSNLYSSYNSLFIPFAEWLQFHLGYQFVENLYLTGTIGFGLNSIYLYGRDPEDDNERINIITLVIAPGLRYHMPVSDLVVMPLGFSIGYKGGFFAVKGTDDEPSYNALKASLYGGVQFLITDHFSFGPGIMLDIEYGVYSEPDYDGEGSKEEDILSIKTGLDLSMSFYF
jgi:hypothetical protein